MIIRNIIRGSFFSIFLVAALFSATVPMAASADHNGNTAQQFIEGLADEAIGALTDENAAREGKIERFRNLLDHNFNVPLIGKWVMGRHWRAASDVEKDEYMHLFEDLIVITYVDRFDQYSGEKINVVNTVMDPGKDAIVYSELVRPGGDGVIRVDWRVRQNGDNYKIVDVYVEGISMGQTQRSEFASVIKQKGGTIEGLLKVLRTKVSTLKQAEK
ncbi:MAG: ABC transporter substrate-binding protein [Rhodospirillaceae bacterium]|nr:ABC transporter substrate-binding protein [Rhodospirillaceae bacterium]